MFKGIQIHLTEPLCKCGAEHLGWSIKMDSKGGPCLNIFCNECKVEMFVPYDQFLASFKLDTSFLKEKTRDRRKNKLTIMDGGKAIPLNVGKEKKEEE